MQGCIYPLLSGVTYIHIIYHYYLCKWLCSIYSKLCVNLKMSVFMNNRVVIDMHGALCEHSTGVGKSCRVPYIAQ